MMKLTILKEGRYNRGFVLFVIDYMKRLFHKRIKLPVVTRITKYFMENIKGKRKIDAFNVIMQAVHNLTIIEYSDSFVVCINRNEKVPNFDKTRLETLCRLINYGNTDLSPYPIFTEVFGEVKEKLPLLYKAYQMNIRAY